MSRPLCKICGLTRKEDVELCHQLGVDFTGFIFVPSSPRRVEPEFVAALPKGPSRRVGVFAGFIPDEVLAMSAQAELDFIQLHGGEDPDFCRALGPERVIKAFWPEKCSPEELSRELELFAPACAYFLFDAGSSGGGSGKRLSLNLAFLRGLPRPWILAGGLGPDNLNEVIKQYGPDVVDLNSGLESAPGVKDQEKVRKAIDILKNQQLQRERQ